MIFYIMAPDSPPPPAPRVTVFSKVQCYSPWSFVFEAITQNQRGRHTHIFNYMDCLLLSFAGIIPREFGRQKQHAFENEGSQMLEAYLLCWCSKLEQADSFWDVCIVCWELWTRVSHPRPNPFLWWNLWTSESNRVQGTRHQQLKSLSGSAEFKKAPPLMLNWFIPRGIRTLLLNPFLKNIISPEF